MKSGFAFGLAAFGLSILQGCASHSHELQTSHVSPAVYKSLDCNELHAEMNLTASRITDLVQIIDKKASDDEGQTAVGLILFWPALFFLEGGDGPEAAEYSRLKGEMNALEHNAISRQCGDAIAYAENYRQQEHEARLARIAKQKELQGDGLDHYR